MTHEIELPLYRVKKPYEEEGRTPSLGDIISHPYEHYSIDPYLEWLADSCINDYKFVFLHKLEDEHQIVKIKIIFKFENEEDYAAFCLRWV